MSHTALILLPIIVDLPHPVQEASIATQTGPLTVTSTQLIEARQKLLNTVTSPMRYYTEREKEKEEEAAFQLAMRNIKIAAGYGNLERFESLYCRYAAYFNKENNLDIALRNAAAMRQQHIMNFIVKQSRDNKDLVTADGWRIALLEGCKAYLND